MNQQTTGRKEEMISAMRRMLETDTSAAAAYVFGSFGTKRFRDDSDIDIGVLYPGKPPQVFSADYIALKGKLEDSLHREVDLVVLNSVSAVLCMQVLKYGQKIFVRSDRVANEFFVRTVNSYSDLRRVRRPIERRILESRIYG